MRQFLTYLLLTISTVKGLSNDKLRVGETSTAEPSNTTEVVPKYDYIVEFGVNLNEQKVPEYLVNVIYNETAQRGITTDDVLSLYNIKTVNLSVTLDSLEKLGIPAENVFSLDGFDKFLTELRVDFKEFYNRVIIEKLNITGNPLRDVLITLNIDVNNFSMGMAYGDPNPYDEFKKGNFSKESVETALQQANRTTDELFTASRDEFLVKALELDAEKIIASLVKYNFGRKSALDLWGILNVTMENVYNVTVFRQLLNDLSTQLNAKPSLGVLTGINNITVNRKVYETWKGIEDVVMVYAVSISGEFILHVVGKQESDLENIIFLKTVAIEPYNDYRFDYVELGKATENLENCQFITLENGSVSIREIPTIEVYKFYLEIPKENVTDLVLGSPLVCENKVYGLARDSSNTTITLDSFSGSGKLIGMSWVVTVSAIVCIWSYISWFNNEC